jgi:hypothetical protein
MPTRLEKPNPKNLAALEPPRQGLVEGRAGTPRWRLSEYPGRSSRTHFERAGDVHNSGESDWIHLVHNERVMLLANTVDTVVLAALAQHSWAEV